MGGKIKPFAPTAKMTSDNMEWMAVPKGGLNPPKPATKPTSGSPPSPPVSIDPNPGDQQNTTEVLYRAMLPHLSPEDYRNLATQLYLKDKKRYADLNPEKSQMPTVPTYVDAAMRKQWTAASRAKEILASLDRVKTILAKTDQKPGAGYDYLRQVATVLRDFGSGEGAEAQTRADTTRVMSALNPLFEGSAPGADKVGDLGRMLAKPYFSAGPVQPVWKDESGKYHFGERQTRWF